MITKTFAKEDLQALVYYDYDPDEHEVIQDKLVETTRWSNVYEMVFKNNGKYYRTSYSAGATECQEERPYEYAPDEIECTEVEPVEVTVTQYKAVK